MRTNQSSMMSEARSYMWRRAVMDIDLNRAPAADENPIVENPSGEQEGPSIQTHLRHDPQTLALFLPMEAIAAADDVIEISSREFYEAKKNSRRNRLTTIDDDDAMDVDLEGEQPPKKLDFICPICLGPFVEEMTTKCGHIFCKTCIKTAIKAKAKCPTCRKKTNLRQIIRVYLPTTD